jgi:hypothetical protein
VAGDRAAVVAVEVAVAVVAVGGWVGSTTLGRQSAGVVGERGVFFFLFQCAKQHGLGWAGRDKTRRDETICGTRSFHGEDVMTMSIKTGLR